MCNSDNHNEQQEKKKDVKEDIKIMKFGGRQ